MTRSIRLIPFIIVSAVALAACGGGGDDGDDGGGQPPPGTTVSGRATYERVPFSTTVGIAEGLDYAGTSALPIRGAVVQLLGTNQTVLATTQTDANGQYSFSAPPNTSVTVRVNAQAVTTGTPSWDISVLNNANSSALYVLDSSVFNTGTTNVTRNLNADSGWPDFGGTSYFAVRAAAPFAVLDTMYSAVQFVVANSSATVNLPALQVFWSDENRPSTIWAPANGDIQTTLYQGDSVGGAAPGIYVLGLEHVDTDEYDQHVLTHEFQHFLENALSRSDTPGGAHSLTEKLDMRLAFSEGFANAFSAMVLDDPQYRDSFGSSQDNSTNLDIEASVPGQKGWYNEASVHALLWDFYDGASGSADPDPDAVELGYGPIFAVFRDELRTGQALTSIFPLVTALKAQAGAPVSGIDALVAAQAIRATDIDPFGSTEINDGFVEEALPLYTDVVLNGPTATVCGSAEVGTFNKVGNRRFLKFSVPAAGTITVRVASPGAGTPIPDPDFVLFGDGPPQVSQADGSTVEQATYAVEVGDYVLEVYEYSHIDPEASGNLSRGDTCMNVTVTG